MTRIKMDIGKNETKPFVASSYQEALFDWIQKGEGSAIVEAVAGSGKTTTIVKALELIPEGKSAIFLAFNRNIAEELKSRIPHQHTASTFHSAGLRAWKNAHPKCAIDERKVRNIVKEMTGGRIDGEINETVVQLVSLAKQRGVGVLTPDIPQAWDSLIDHFDMSVPEYIRSRVIKMSQNALQESIRSADYIIDFDDMIYMTVFMEHIPYTYDWVFIDEAQDTNGVRRELAKMLLKPNGRLIAVGDPHQAIYGFTGADSDAIDLIRDEFGCETFPLSICYRSAHKIVETAKAYVPNIEAAPDAPAGIVKDTTFDAVPPMENDAILCRNTAPLVNLAYELISQGRGCRILGRDIGRSLGKLIDRLKARDLNDLHDKLMNNCSREAARFRKEDKENRAQSIEDKTECIYAVMANLPETDQTIKGLIEHIEKLFQEEDGKILLTLSTVHKAKGLEWNRVYIYMPGLMPSKHAKTAWQIKQEMNLQYVAVTRAKKELYFVAGRR